MVKKKCPENIELVLDYVKKTKIDIKWLRNNRLIKTEKLINIY